jgi:hypothetical protein
LEKFRKGRGANYWGGVDEFPDGGATGFFLRFAVEDVVAGPSFTTVVFGGGAA